MIEDLREIFSEIPKKERIKRTPELLVNQDQEERLELMRTKEIIKELDEEMEGEQKKPLNSPASPTIAIKCGNFQTEALVDTGAQISAMTNQCYKVMKETRELIQELPVSKVVLKGALSDRGVAIKKKVRMRFWINEQDFIHEFMLVDNLSYQIILGIDFLSKYHFRITCDMNMRIERINSENRKIIKINILTIEEARKRLSELIRNNEEIFSDQIGQVNHYRHGIRTQNLKPYKCKTYPIPDIYMDRVREYIGKLKKDKIISRRATQYINPLVVVVKKNGKIRLCLDARELNKITLNDHAQPPTIEEVFQLMGRKKYFTTLDVTEAFWQIPLEEKSKEFTGFLFEEQSYVFNRMPFGLKTAGASFTRAMNEALKELGNQFLIIYLDDILIASDNLQDHLEHLRQVFACLKRVGFKLNVEKCEFIKEEIKFLGHTFDQIKAEINDDTRKAISSFERPKTKRALQSFLGLINWDRRFIENLAQLTRPMEELLAKDRKFIWTNKQQEAFDKMKLAFEKAGELFLIKKNGEFGIYADASIKGLGARLFQYDKETQKEYTLAFASRSLKGAEKNYHITDLECLAVVWALRKWYTLLMGRRVRIHTDHRALNYLSTCVRNSTRIARWWTFLQEFELDIRHIPGKSNMIADRISRQCEDKQGGKVTKKIEMIKDKNEGTNTAEWVRIIKQSQEQDERLQQLTERYPESIIRREELIRARIREGDRIILPEKIIWKIARKVHEFLIHFGTEKVLEFMNKYFVGFNFDRIIKDVVASCEICQATKYYTRPTIGAILRITKGIDGNDVFGFIRTIARNQG